MADGIPLVYAKEVVAAKKNAMDLEKTKKKTSDEDCNTIEEETAQGSSGMIQVLANCEDDETMACDGTCRVVWT